MMCSPPSQDVANPCGCWKHAEVVSSPMEACITAPGPSWKQEPCLMLWHCLCAMPFQSLAVAMAQTQHPASGLASGLRLRVERAYGVTRHMCAACNTTSCNLRMRSQCALGAPAPCGTCTMRHQATAYPSRACCWCRCRSWCAHTRRRSCGGGTRHQVRLAVAHSTAVSLAAALEHQCWLCC